MYFSLLALTCAALGADSPTCTDSLTYSGMSRELVVAVPHLIRARRDIGAGSTFGLLYTDRSLEGGGTYNRVATALMPAFCSGDRTRSPPTRPAAGPERPTAPAAGWSLSFTHHFSAAGVTFNGKWDSKTLAPGFAPGAASSPGWETVTSTCSGSEPSAAHSVEELPGRGAPTPSRRLTHLWTRHLRAHAPRDALSASRSP
jgi:hypothetical protein